MSTCCHFSYVLCHWFFFKQPYSYSALQARLVTELAWWQSRCIKDQLEWTSMCSLSFQDSFTMTSTITLACRLVAEKGCHIPLHYGDQPIPQESWWMLPESVIHLKVWIFHSPLAFHGQSLYVIRCFNQILNAVTPTILQTILNSPPNLPLWNPILPTIQIIPFFKGALWALDGIIFQHTPSSDLILLLHHKGGVSQNVLVATTFWTCTFLHLSG